MCGIMEVIREQSVGVYLHTIFLQCQHPTLPSRPNITRLYCMSQHVLLDSIVIEVRLSSFVCVVWPTALLLHYSRIPNNHIYTVIYFNTKFHNIRPYSGLFAYFEMHVVPRYSSFRATFCINHPLQLGWSEVLFYDHDSKSREKYFLKL